MLPATDRSLSVRSFSHRPLNYLLRSAPIRPICAVTDLGRVSTLQLASAKRAAQVSDPPPRPRKAMKVGSHAQAGRRGRGPDVDGRGAHPRRGPVGRGPHLRRTGGVLVAGGGGGARHNDGGVPAPTSAGIARTILVVDVVLVVAALLEAQQGSATRAGAVGAWVYVAGVTSGTLEN